VLKGFQYLRFVALIAFLLLGFGWLVSRLVDIQIVRHEELRKKAAHYTRIVRRLEAWRGEIRDRQGNVVAASFPVKTIYANLTLCSNRIDQVVRTITPLLRLPPAELSRCLNVYVQSGQQKTLVLRREVPVWEWHAITNALALETFGINALRPNERERRLLSQLRHNLLLAEDEQVRVYPNASSLSQVAGFVMRGGSGNSLHGVYGIERSMDKWLSGTDGNCVSEQDAAGNEIPFRRTVYVPPTNGCRIDLTIDLRLQKLVEGILVDAMRKYEPSNAAAIVMDIRTSEILAWAGQPDFNPQMPGAGCSSNYWRNVGLSDMIEPGSTLKLVALAGALNEGLVTLDTWINCEQGHYVVNKVVVRNSAGHGILTTTQCFAKSDNVGLCKIAMLLGPDRFNRYLRDFGFGRVTAVPLIGEASGYIPSQPWSTQTFTRAVYGQGLSASLLQVAAAYCAVANDGRLMRPILVRQILSPQGQVFYRSQPQFIRAVVNPQTSRQLRIAMKAVTGPEGTGWHAASDAYSVAAKTGTAQIAYQNERGYHEGAYYASLAGFFPADAPRLCILVAMNQPRNGHAAGQIVAPVFRAIVDEAGSCLSIPPDKAPVLPGQNRRVALAENFPGGDDGVR
jgi:cell division protein FtsI/penicillin-binding protein 2